MNVFRSTLQDRFGQTQQKHGGVFIVGQLETFAKRGVFQSSQGLLLINIKLGQCILYVKYIFIQYMGFKRFFIMRKHMKVNCEYIISDILYKARLAGLLSAQTNHEYPG